MADKTTNNTEATANEKPATAPATQAANDSKASAEPKAETKAAEEPKKADKAKASAKKPAVRKKKAAAKRKTAKTGATVKATAKAAKAKTKAAKPKSTRKTAARAKTAKAAGTKKHAAAKQASFRADAAAATNNVNQFFKTYNVQTMEDIMTQGKTQFDKLAQDAQTAGKDQLDAIVKSGNIFAKGFENIFKTYVSIAQTSAEKNSQAFQSLLACKTLNEFTETQNKVAQQNFDDFLSGVTKISELSVKVTTDAFEPINDQVSKSIQKASESIAA